MAAQIKSREAELAGLSPEHRNAEIANMMRQMVDASLKVGARLSHIPHTLSAHSRWWAPASRWARLQRFTCVNCHTFPTHLPTPSASPKVGQAPCCSNGDCKPPTLQQGGGGSGVCDQPPGAGVGGGGGAGEEVSRAAGGAGQWQAAGNNMSQEDQLRFFQALSQAPS